MTTTAPLPTVTLREAKALVRALAHDRSLLLLSPPGVGKSDTVIAAAAEAGLACRSLLGTQIAPEDVSGVPRIVGERSVFCPPRILLPETDEPVCLFLDELPACAPDVQKAFYSLLLERRVGEFALPRGSWVVAAGNRAEDRALIRTMSSALVNRVTILQVRVDVPEWLQWAAASGVRKEVMSFITFQPAALMRPVPIDPAPFSTPRAWASLSRALDLADRAGALTTATARALAFGTVSAADASLFCAAREAEIPALHPAGEYVADPALVPEDDSGRWFVLCLVRDAVERGDITATPTQVDAFLRALPREHRFAVLVGLVERWGALGADAAMLDTLTEATGLAR